MGSQKVSARSPAHGPGISGFRQEIRRSLRAAGVARGEHLLVGCSHGPDSLALADAVVALRRPLGLSGVTLVYVDHGLRAAAKAEGRAVLAFAEAHGVEAVVRTADPGRFSGGGPEDAARQARLGVLEDEMERRQAAWTLLGHTASDQAETVLMRLLRGAGTRGLSGIAERRGRFLRPMLRLTRGEVEAYLAARALIASVDASNATDDFLRNRVRHQILPLLRGENPSIDESLRRAAGALRETDDALETFADRVEAAARVGDDALRRGVLVREPVAVGKRLIQRAANRMGCSLSATQIDSVWDLVLRGGSGRQLSARRLVVRCERGLVRFVRRDHGR